MRKATHRLFPLLACLAALACRTAPTPHYYLLTADVERHAAPAEPSTAVIGIGPIEFPSYLDRPQVVVRRGAVEVEPLEFHRWAEPLEKSFATVLAEEISARTGSDRVLVFPWSSAENIGRRVKGKVIRFDVDASGLATLVVRWHVKDGAGNVLRPTQRSRFTAAASSGEPAALVKAMAATLSAFSAELAAALKE